MEILSSVKNIEMIEKLPSSHSLVLGCEYSFYADNYFTINEIKDIYQKYHNQRKIYVLLNLIMHINNQEEINDFIDELSNLDIYFIFQDLGIFNLLLKKGIINRGIYNPLTMITNYLDLKEYTSLGINAVGLSNEITLEDVYKTSLEDNNVFYLGFGYHPMYQTYRPLLSLYKEESGLDFKIDNTLLLQEKTRPNDRCPIIENKYGTIIFRSGVISILHELDKVNSVKYLFIDGIFISEDKYLKVNELFNKLINNLDTKENVIKEFNELDLRISNEFLYSDSVYNPKEFE